MVLTTLCAFNNTLNSCGLVLANLVGGRFYHWYGGRNLFFWSGLLCFVWSFLIVCFVFGEWVANKKRSTIGKWDKMVEGEGEGGRGRGSLWNNAIDKNILSHPNILIGKPIQILKNLRINRKLLIQRNFRKIRISIWKKSIQKIFINLFRNDPESTTLDRERYFIDPRIWKLVFRMNEDV